MNGYAKWSLVLVLKIRTSTSGIKAKALLHGFVISSFLPAFLMRVIATCYDLYNISRENLFIPLHQ